MTTKHDSGKDRWDLLPLRAVREVVRVLTFGSRKYAEWNWVTVPNARERYKAALDRHVAAWWCDGERLDPESELHHLAHAACDVLFLLALEVGDTRGGYASAPTGQPWECPRCGPDCG